MIRAAILLPLALAGAPAAAVPVYLTCTLQTSKNPLVSNLTMDEEHQLVTMEIPATGLVQKHQALFSAEKVAFSTSIGPSSINYLVSRTNLSFSRTIVTPSQTLSPDVGVCKIQEAPKRAF